MKMQKGDMSMEEIIDDVQMDEDTQKGKFLTFSLGKEEYGLEIKYVTEIVGLQPITQVPDLPDYVKGIINLRGKIIPVIDMRIRFKKDPKDYNDRTCIIVVEISDISVGLIVDTVAEVISIGDESIVPPPEVNKGYQRKYIKAIGKVGEEVKLLLNCNKLLNEDETENINELIEG